MGGHRNDSNNFQRCGKAWAKFATLIFHVELTAILTAEKRHRFANYLCPSLCGTELSLTRVKQKRVGSYNTAL